MAKRTTEVKVLPNDSIETLAARLVDAYQQGLEAHATFDGVDLFVKGGDTVDDVLLMYKRAKTAAGRPA